jgi:hypothetical protein
MKKSLDTAFVSEDYTVRREETLQQYEEKKQELWSELNKRHVMLISYFSVARSEY